MKSNSTSHIGFLNRKTWKDINRTMLAKSLAELMHEEVAKPEITGEENGITNFRLNTDHENIHYTFSAQSRMMDYWHIIKESIRKHVNGRTVDSLDVPRFFTELQHTFCIKPFTLAHYVEELQHTLYADALIHYKGRLPAGKLADADYQTIEHQMDGHPWVIVNKSRLGFNAKDCKTYAPETDHQLQLSWVAAHKSRAAFQACEGIHEEEFFEAEVGIDRIGQFRDQLAAKGVNWKEYVFLPIHSWQWDNKLEILFAGDIAEDLLIPLGQGDDVYSPQQSIRTFFNVSAPQKHYVKTSVSILSTGNIRGLSPKQMAIAPRVTKWVKEVLRDDRYLQSTGVVLIGEVATATYLHPDYASIKEIPYQYNEMLGALWRESAFSYLKQGEKMMTMAALLYVDDQGNSLTGALIERSGLTAHDWLKAYLKAYLKPLLHLYYQHSICVTPHGENIILVMIDHVPVRIIIKDFVDDIVLTQEAIEKLPEDLAQGMIKSSNKENVPLFVLIGIFDAFFRYLSDIMQTSLGFDEKQFWNSVLDIVLEYQEENTELKARFEKYDLFVPEFKRFYINSLRLHEGYEERTGFAIPKKGGKLPNPLAAIRQQMLV